MNNDGKLRLPTSLGFDWLLRWRFDLPKSTKCGLWCSSGNTNEDKACFVNKEGLIRASIEGKNVKNRSLKSFCEIDGPNFCNFEWVGATAIPGVSGGFKVQSKIIGLTLVSRDFRTTVYIDGRIEVKPRTEQDKKFHYAGFGK